MGVKKVYFVRHGETEGNSSKHFQFPETALTEAGHRGAQAVALRFENIQIDTIIASPFKRAQQTAQYVSEKLELPFRTVEAFHERLQPTAMRGRSIPSPEGQAYLKAYPEMYFENDTKPEGFENFADVLKRVKECVSLLEAESGENIVVISHGAFLRSVTSFLLVGKDEDVAKNRAVDLGLHTMSNVGITEWTLDGDVWRLFTWNDHAHFAE